MVDIKWSISLKSKSLGSYHKLVYHMMHFIWWLLYGPYNMDHLTLNRVILYSSCDIIIANNLLVHMIWSIMDRQCQIMDTVMNFRTNLDQTWNGVHNLRNICSCSNKAHIKILMNVKESWNDLMFLIIRKENWIIIEFNCDNFVTFTTRCRCHNPISINHSPHTKIILLSLFTNKGKDQKWRTSGIHRPPGPSWS